MLRCAWAFARFIPLSARKRWQASYAWGCTTRGPALQPYDCKARMASRPVLGAAIQHSCGGQALSSTACYAASLPTMRQQCSRHLTQNWLLASV